MRGVHNTEYGLGDSGLGEAAKIHCNLHEAALVEASIAAGEARLTRDGALLALTGHHTGRSPGDRFIVREDGAPCIDWTRSAAMEPAHFEALHADMCAYAAGAELYMQDLHICADPACRLNVRFLTQNAWHALFVRHLLRRPDRATLEDFMPRWALLNLPMFAANPFRHGCHSQTVIAISFARRMILIGGTSYAGENKKAIFSVLNALLPERGVMPMHCSANHAPGDPDDSALFFGLSGTGKTTLSANPDRTLIGDDEHGWSDEGVFNFEGGCYAKTLDLSERSEPFIYAATRRFGAVLENVAMDPLTRIPDFTDRTLTENTRVAYPLEAIPNVSATSRAGHPKHVVLLTCDAFGVLPPIARLSEAQLVYHFLSGYTSRVAGTETGLTKPEPVFSACFGAPFMPRDPVDYATLLRKKIARHDTRCWLVNTGWSGGPYGVGARMPIEATRRLLSTLLSGGLDDAPCRRDGAFGFDVPLAVDGVESALLKPEATWADGSAFAAQASVLVAMFRENFRQFAARVPADIRAAGPADAI